MNGDRPNAKATNFTPIRGRATQDEPTRVAEQLRGFLRRNLSWLLGAALALLVLHDVFGTHGLLAMHRSRQEAARIRKAIQQLNEENRQMQERMKELKSDPQAIERIAREEMGLARPGERIFKIPPNPQVDSSTTQAPTNQPTKP